MIENFEKLVADRHRLDAIVRRTKQPEMTKKIEENYRRSVACYKEMYKYAREGEAPRTLMIEKILKRGLDQAIGGHLYSALSTGDKNQAMIFKNDAKRFAEVGHTLAKTVFGKESSVLSLWNDKIGTNLDAYLEEKVRVWLQQFNKGIIFVDLQVRNYVENYHSEDQP